MEKLRKIIQQLSATDFAQIKSTLIKNDADKLLNVLIFYSENDVTDEDVRKRINCSEGSFYVLKSRLLNKIQELLVKNNEVQKTSLLQEDITLTQYLYEYPRETAIVTLLQLEKIYISNDTPQELISVYSALKKIHYHSDKYYYYSQLYNKQIAYTVALEKAEDILLNFNKTLSNYIFSQTDDDKELLVILNKEIKNVYSLNQSHRFELIKIFILIQSQLFANIELSDEESVEDLIKRCEQVIENYPKDNQNKYYKNVVDYFWVEYYFKITQYKKALLYFEAIQKNSKTWLLLNNYCVAFNFLLTKPQLLYKLNKTEQLSGVEEDICFDNYDFYTLSALKFCKAITAIYNGNINKSIAILFDLISDISLHHFFHLELEIKLTLAYLYIKQNEKEKAIRILTSISRKINNGKKKNYRNAVLFIKLLNLLLDEDRSMITITIIKEKAQDIMQQFNLHNSSERKLLCFLQPDVELYIKNIATLTTV